MSKIYFFVAFLLLFLFPAGISAQQDINPEKITEYKVNVQNLVDFLEYSFNTLGDPATPVRDKDVIINQSYAKIFRDAEVQIEDDLDDNRETLINKDVQAYLKDIDFFFKQAVFSLNVSSIEQRYTAEQELYFLVTLTRTLNATTITDDTVSSNRERFIEVNFDEEAQDLRIVSIYTTKIDEREELFAWWNNMPTAWREVLGHEAIITDTVRLSNVIEINDSIAVAQHFGMVEVPVDTFLVYGGDTLFIEETDTLEALLTDTLILQKNVAYRMLQRLSSETEIDISNNLNINSLTPLSSMGELKKVSCANTLVDDLHPLRNLINIRSLDCSGTPVKSIAPLQYSISLKSLDISSTIIQDAKLLSNLRNLEQLDISNTTVDSIEMLREMKHLEDLRMNNTMIADLSPLEKLTSLRILNLSGTYVRDLDPIRGLENLERLYMSNTAVENLQPLAGLEKLQTIYLDTTNVSDLNPLSGLEKLESIYCDNTGITAGKANKFMAANTNVMVIYESVALTNWWYKMPEAWRDIFREQVQLDPEPTKEQLHRAIKITEIDVSGKHGISSLLPVKNLVHLNKLDCSHTSIDNLWPLSELIDLQYLDCSYTPVSNCEPLHDLTKLDYLDLSNTAISNIECISRIKGMRVLKINGTATAKINVFGKSNIDLIYAEETAVDMGEVIAFRKDNPETTIVYQTSELQAWWTALPAPWREVFSKASGIKGEPGAEDLQRIADLTEIDISQNNAITGLTPLLKLYLLQSLKMNDTQIADLSPISTMGTIEKLNISNNPVSSLEAISGLTNLLELEFRNTRVDDLEALTGLTRLRVLDMAGTDIKKIDELAFLGNLEELSIYNTRVKSLDPLEGLTKLKLLKCYNTNLKEKKVEKFQEKKPGVEIVFY
jgi:hypothetical protein|nr:leucine-rich repeat domain-containing protein [Bacteroidales bacterium]